MISRILLVLAIVVVPDALTAQGRDNGRGLFGESRFSGELQTEMQYCLPNSNDNLSDYTKRFLSNTYLDLRYSSRMLELGMRVEAFENPLPGFERDYKGVGVPYFYLTLNFKSLQITGGDFYEQFGGGLVLRSYYERSLGLDNALRGGRIKVQPAGWMEMKVLAGRQRHYWSTSGAFIAGADIGFDIDRMFRRMDKSGRRLHIGAGWVSKWEDEKDILVNPTERLHLPKVVGAFATRLNYGYKGYSLQGEYAYKINDPSAENQYIYRPGQTLLLTSSYSRSGFGITIGVKHTDNMSFRSDRTVTGRMLQINYLPAFTHQQSYTLANMYPYATQAQGEVAFQVDLFYKIKKHTLLGGKYGTDFRFNFSHVNALDRDYRIDGSGSMKGTYGYDTHLFAIGDELYYQDFNLDISHRLTRNTKLQFAYINQKYNQLQIEGHADNGNIVNTNVFVLEATQRLSKKVGIRAEAQYLATEQDKGDWVAGLLELSVSSNWMFTVMDLYNLGDTPKNYLLASVAYSTGAHRLQLSGGQQRAGITCVGGICRYVPATNGFSLTYTVNFNMQKK